MQEFWLWQPRPLCKNRNNSKFHTEHSWHQYIIMRIVAIQTVNSRCPEVSNVENICCWWKFTSKWQENKNTLLMNHCAKSFYTWRQTAERKKALTAEISCKLAGCRQRGLEIIKKKKRRERKKVSKAVTAASEAWTWDTEQFPQRHSESVVESSSISATHQHGWSALYDPLTLWSLFIYSCNKIKTAVLDVTTWGP